MAAREGETMIYAVSATEAESRSGSPTPPGVSMNMKSYLPLSLYSATARRKANAVNLLSNEYGAGTKNRFLLLLSAMTARSGVTLPKMTSPIS